MSENSRVKKYEKIRGDIENDRGVTNNIGDSLKAYNNNLNSSESAYVPSHEKNFEEENSNKMTNNKNSFKNEYLDSFIQEVREYNIQKGVREYEDTKLDILQQLSSKNREKRSNYIEKIEENNIVEENNDFLFSDRDRSFETVEISKQVFELLNDVEPVIKKEAEAADIEDDVEHIISSELKKAVDVDNVEPSETEKDILVGNALEERIVMLKQKKPDALNPVNDFSMLEDIEKNDVDAISEDEISTITKEALLEQTMQLKVQMDKYKDDLSEINNDVDKNNRLLNIIIMVLILSLLAVILVVIYWLVAGGVI